MALRGTVLTLFGLTLAGCGGTLGTVRREWPGQPLYVCGDVPFTATALRSASGAENRPEAPAHALRRFLASGIGDPDIPQSRGWRWLSGDENNVTFGHLNRRGQVDACASAERKDDWEITTWGGGPPDRIIRGAEVTQVQLRGHVPPAPGDRVLHLSVLSGTCVPGPPDPRGRAARRIVRIQTHWTARALVLLAVMRKAPTPTGSRGKVEACAGVGLSVPYELTLAKPFGHRRLLDGSTLPPSAVEQDPTAPS